jgi:hypothetical protein
MGHDGFPFCWDACCLGDGYTSQGATASLNTGTAPFMSAFSVFFQKKIWLSALFSFRLVWGFANSGKFLLRRPFSETSVHGNSFSTGKLTSFFPFLSYSLYRGCVLSGWGAKGFAFTLFFFYFGRSLRRV